ncbi:hypothetical protein MMC21_002677 [Puttea exsequens]|nr:hypothetical protein [Puttea exsequens]
MSLYQRLRAIAMTLKSHIYEEVVSKIDGENLPELIKNTRAIARRGRDITGASAAGSEEDAPASITKCRPMRLASLVLNGAVPGWQVQLYDSSDGLAVCVEKELAGENGNIDALTLTDLELKENFEHGIPMKSGSLAWTTQKRGYPEIYHLSSTDKDGTVFHKAIPVPSTGSSILSQLTKAERMTLPDGSISTKVTLINRFGDGTLESEEITDDAGRVYNERHKVMLSAISRRRHERATISDQLIKPDKKFVGLMEDLLRDDCW